VILTTDVAYRGDTATAVGLLHGDWRTCRIARAVVKTSTAVVPYEPGRFYKRKLPCLLSLVAAAGRDLEAIVIDGYVDLGTERRPGLGRHLYEALGRTVPVVGVAKTAFRDAPEECRLYRGRSRTPLYVTAAGLPLALAKARIKAMHGPYRIPTLLKQADRLCRDGADA
jgi:deoxyribonuclease V